MPTGIGSGIAGEVFTDEIGSGSRGGSTICPTRYSVEFNGSSQWGSEEDTKIDLGTDNFSFSFWFKTIGGGTKQGFHTTRLGSGANGLDIYLSAAGQLTADFDTISFVGSTVPSDNEWHHAVLSVDRLGDWKWYLDGVNINTVDHSAVTAPIENGGTSAWARTTNSPVDYFDGNLTELSIWGTALSSSEVLTIYNNMFGSQTCLTDLTFSSGNLIQNGSFNEIGPQLIDNPTFNAPTSPDLIVNGDFSELGADVIYNGGFDTSIALGTTGSGWVNPDAAAAYNLGGCKITRGVAGFARLRGADILGNDDIISLSKSYKITYTVVENNGAASVIFDLAGTFSNDIPLSLTTHTVYVTSGTSATQRFQVYNQTASSNITLTDIVVKELGADWTLQDEWSIGEDKATYDATANAKNIKQLLNFELGKSYKIKFTTSTGTAKLKFTDQSGTQLFTDIAIANYAPNSYELYGTAIASTELRIYAYNSGGAEAFSITNISVQEVDWAFGGGWSLGSNKALATAAAGGDTLYQTGVFTLDKSYKTTFLSTLDSGNCFAEFGSDGFIGQLPSGTASNLFYYQTNEVGDSARIAFEVQSPMTGSISNVLTYQMDPNGYWNIPTANSTQLVLNPMFTNTGPEEVTNGDFSQTALGTDLVTDGEFPSGTTAWTLRGTSALNVGSATVEGRGDLGATSVNRGVSQPVTILAGTSYKITFTAKQLTGTGAMYAGLGYTQPFNQVITSDYEVYTFDQVPANVAGSWPWICFGGAVGSTFEIKDVSVKEVLQLVSNGDFTDTVSRIENGDFLDYTVGGSFGIAIADWKQNANTTGEVTYTKTAEGIKFIIDVAPTNSWDTRLYSGVGNVPLALTDGKSYRVRYSVKGYNASGNFVSKMSWLNGNYPLVSDPPGINDTTWTDVDEYIIASNVSGVNPGDGQYLQFWSLDKTVGDWMEVKDVSVEELGADWYEQDTGAMSIVAEGLKITTATAGSNRASQDDVTEDGKSYKVTVVVDSISTPTLNDKLFYYNGLSYINIPLTTPKSYTFYYTRVGTLDRWIFDLRNGATTSDNIVISSISVQELGEGWSVSAVGGFSFNGSGLSLNSSAIDTSGGGGGTVFSACQQVGSIFDVGKSYKLVIEDLDITSGSIELKFGLNHATVITRPILTSADNGTYVYYLVAEVDSDSFTISSATGTVATLGSISVKETGLDWISPDAGTVNTFNATGLTMTSVNGGTNNNRIRQVGVTADDQAYKVDYTIVGSSLTAGNYLQFYTGGTYIDMKTSVGSHTLHYTRSGTNDDVYLRLKSTGSTTDTVDIGSITIVEVQGWTLEDGKLVGDLPDLAKSATQDIGAIAGNSYKATMDVAIAEEELITNGSFREVGADLVLEGDFPKPSVHWLKAASTTINGGSATFGGLGTVADMLAGAFVVRVEADGGVVEAQSCLISDLTFLTENP
jgi:hypothetical protein